MAIAFVAAGAVTSGSGIPFTVAVPAGISAGNLLVVAATGSTLTAPTGWTKIYNQSTGNLLQVFTKYAGQSESAANFGTVLGAATRAVMLAYSGAGNYDVISTLATGTSTTATTTSQTTTYANDYVVSFYSTTSTAATFSTPTGTTSRSNSASTGTLNGLLVVDELQAAAGASATRASTLSASVLWSCVSISFIPTRTLYWVGGTGTWDTTTTTNWANSSGGAGGARPPAQNETATIDTSSGTGTITCTAGVCGDLTVTASQAIILGAASSTLTVGGSLSFPAAGSFSASTNANTITFNPLSNAKTITTNGKTFSSITVNNDASGTVTLSDNLTANATATLTAGNLALSTRTLTCLTFNTNNTNTRSITASTGGNITTTGTGTVFNSGTNTTGIGLSGSPSVQVNISNNTATAITLAVSNGTNAGNSFLFNIINGSYALTVSNSGTAGIAGINFTGTYTGTWAPGTQAFYINGSVTLVSGMTFTTPTGIWNLNQTNTLTTAGKTLGPINFSGGPTTLGDNLTAGNATWDTASTLAINAKTTSIGSLTNTTTNNTFTVSGGTLNCTSVSMGSNGITPTLTLGTSGNIVDTGAFNFTNGTLNVTGGNFTCLTFGCTTNVNTPILAFGSSGSITVTGSGATAYNDTALTSVTGTSTINISNNSATATTVTETSGQILNFNFTTGTYALTVTTASIFGNLNFTGFTGSWALGAGNAYTIKGDLTLVSGMGFTTSSSTFTFDGTGTQTITSGGKTLPATTQNGTGGTVTFAANTTFGANTYTHSRGTVDLATNNVTLTCTVFDTNASTVRAIAFGTGAITVTGTATPFTSATATNLTYTGTSRINVTSSSTATVNAGTTGGTVNNAFNFYRSAGTTFALTTGSVVRTLDFTGYTGTWSPGTASATFYGDLTLVSGMTFTTPTGGAWTFAATSGTQVITSASKTLFSITQSGVGGTVQLAANTTLSTTATYTFSNGTLDLGTNTATLSTGLFSSSNFNTRSIIFGTGNITTTGSGSAWSSANLGGFSYTGTPTVKISNNSATATTIVHGTTTGNATTAIDFNITVGTYALTITSGSVIRSLDFTGFTGTWSTGTATYTFYGSLTLVSGMTFTTGTGIWSFFATSGTQTITSAGKTLYAITQNGIGGTVALGDAITLSNTYTLTNGTFNASNQNFTSTTFNSNNSNTRTITMGSGTWTLSSTGTVWDTSTTTGLTLNSDTSTIVLSNTTTTARTFAGGGLTYNNLTIGGATGISTLTFTGNNTFNTLASTKTVAHTITLPASGTTTVADWTITGTAGNIVTLNSSTAGTQSTLTKTGGGTINVSYMSIQDSNATPSNTWYAPIANGNTNVSNNTGWVFSLGSSGNYFLLF
jgi:hypothetical protein